MLDLAKKGAMSSSGVVQVSLVRPALRLQGFSSPETSGQQTGIIKEEEESLQTLEASLKQKFAEEDEEGSSRFFRHERVMPRCVCHYSRIFFTTITFHSFTLNLQKGPQRRRRRRRRKRPSSKRDPPPAAELRQSYDPWRDIFQRGDFKQEGSRPQQQNRRSDPGDQDYAYYDGIPVGAEYLYYEYDPYEQEEEEEKESKKPPSKADRRTAAEEERDKRRPYDFERPVELGGMDPFSLSKKDAAAAAGEKPQSYVGQLQQQPTIMKRVADAVFRYFYFRYTGYITRM